MADFLEAMKLVGNKTDLWQMKLQTFLVQSGYPLPSIIVHLQLLHPSTENSASETSEVEYVADLVACNWELWSDSGYGQGCPNCLESFTLVDVLPTY